MRQYTSKTIIESTKEFLYRRNLIIPTHKEISDFSLQWLIYEANLKIKSKTDFILYMKHDKVFIRKICSAFLKNNLIFSPQID